MGPAKLSGEWRPDQAERDAACERYVELVTRIAVVPMSAGHGIRREALTSLYQLFGVTREILRKYGAAQAKPPRKGEYRFGAPRGVDAQRGATAGAGQAASCGTGVGGHACSQHGRCGARGGVGPLGEGARGVGAAAGSAAAARGDSGDGVCEAPALLDATHTILGQNNASQR